MERLECGTALAALVEQVTEGRPVVDGDHQARCPFCQSSLTRIREAWEALRALAAIEIAVPAGLTLAIMRRIREASPPDVVGASPRVVAAEPLFASWREPMGATRLGAGVLATIALAAARPGPDAAVRTVHVDVDEHQRAVLTMTIVVRYGPAIPVVAADLRARVADQVEALSGVPVATVDVVVEDIEAPTPLR